MNKPLDNTGLKSFNDYISKYKEEARTKESKDYFHVDVVTQAFTEGYNKGKKIADSQFVNELINERNEKFQERSTLIYILSKKVVDYIKELKYSPISLHINLKTNRPSVIIAVPSKALLKDCFIDNAYEKLFEIRDTYEKLTNEILDIGYIGGGDIDKSLLKADGFGYSETF
ncbi:MAG: hypothetical protein ACOCVX_01295 [Bacteroidales bacterium]